MRTHRNCHRPLLATLILSAAVIAPAVASAPPASAASDGFSGTVFSDRNWNGVRDAGEEPLAGVVLEVVRALEPYEAFPGVVAPILATATSGADGRYRFSGLPSGTKFGIRAAEVQPVHIDQLGFNGVLRTTFGDRYKVGPDGTSVLQDFYDITAIDIGISRYHEVNIDAWVDLDGDGVMDPDEPSPAGLHADLLDGNGATVATTSPTTTPERWSRRSTRHRRPSPSGPRPTAARPPSSASTPTVGPTATCSSSEAGAARPPPTRRCSRRPTPPVG